MVSTRHHPRPFPPPPEPTSPPSTSTRNPQTPTSTTPSSRTISNSPTRQTPSTTRSRSRKRKSTTTSSPQNEDKTETLKSALTRSTSKSQRSHSRSHTTRTASTSAYTHTPPPFLIPWLLVSLPLVIWDTLYILLRPHTMPGGRLHYPIWAPYELYGRIDYIYGLPAWEQHNGFTAAQGSMNAIETACYIYYLYVVARRVVSGDGFVRGVAVRSLNVFARRDEKERDKIVVRGGTDVAGAVVLLFVTLVLTSAKTVLYMFNEHFSGWKHVRHNFETPLRLIGLWVLPNSPWIVVPAILGWIVGKEIVEAMCTDKGGRRV